MGLKSQKFISKKQLDTLEICWLHLTSTERLWRKKNSSSAPIVRLRGSGKKLFLPNVEKPSAKSGCRSKSSSRIRAAGRLCLGSGTKSNMKTCEKSSFPSFKREPKKNGSQIWETQLDHVVPNSEVTHETSHLHLGAEERGNMGFQLLAHIIPYEWTNVHKFI